MLVNQVATMAVEVARAEEPILDVAQRMGQSEIGFLPVMAHGKVVGILTDRDLALRVLANDLDPKKVHAKDVMSHDVYGVREDADIEEGIRTMMDKAVRRLVVTDRNGEPVGILSLDDIAIFTNGDATTGRVLQRIAASSPSFSALRAF